MDDASQTRKAFVEYCLARYVFGANEPVLPSVPCCLTCTKKRIRQYINVCGRDGLPIHLDSICDQWEADKEHA